MPRLLVGVSKLWCPLPKVTDTLVKTNELCDWILSRDELAMMSGAGQSLTCLVTCHHLLPVFSANHGLKPRAVALGEQAVYQGPIHCIATIVRTEGLAGLYRGSSAMLLRDVPGYCLYFIPYVFLSEWITPESCTGPSPYAVWLAGGIAGKDNSSGSPIPGSQACHGGGKVQRSPPRPSQL